MAETTVHPAHQAGLLYTIGHSNRSLDNLIDVLLVYGIQQLIDVRSHPGSRRFPLFNRNDLNLALAEEGITYSWFGHELGGLRRARPDSPHIALPAGFRAYADHMCSNAFQVAIKHLMSLARTKTMTMMCAERDPYQCHRSLIADYLVFNHWRVVHLIDVNSPQEHTISPLARNQNQLPIYDRLEQQQLDLSF